MSFDISSYNSVVDGLEKFLDDIDGKVRVAIPQAEQEALDLPYVRLIPPVQRAVKTCADKLIEICKWLWDKVIEIMKGIRAPYDMYLRSRDWTDVRDSVSSIQGEIDPNNLAVNRVWKGAAQLAYMKANTAQSAASGKVGDIADKTKTVLIESAVAGLAFYAGLLSICWQFLANLAAAIAALATGVGAPISLADIAADSGITTAQIWVAVGLLSAFVGQQARSFGDLHSAASDNSSFPGGRWPDPISSTFSDASVGGDNESKWRLN
ncbi:hypothetical protein ACIA5H_06540 [Nocardia sp. NPDC051900]|uniref:hypothetical protein n=1 Tax=Nocardia sp. NPDC051900 TaxID=3364326 RepID=UPI003796DE3B